MNFIKIKISIPNTVMGALLFLLAFAFSSCEDDNAIEKRNWQLVWEDEFEGPAGQSPDASKWTYDLGRGPNEDGWGNAELQFYTQRPENVSLDGSGNLAITARSESFAGASYTSARIKTQGLFAQTFGRFEARIKLPWGSGIWPAFWMLGSDIETIGWPQCGEIDIMEYRGQEPNIIHGSVHGPGYSGESPITKSYGFENDRFDQNFHLFAIEWDRDYINFFVDDILYQQIKPIDAPGEWVYDHSFFILLNVAVGGNYVGFPNRGTSFPQTMLVDFVRVYSESL
jgi:beta-glucanase (GH16 family)